MGPFMKCKGAMPFMYFMVSNKPLMGGREDVHFVHRMRMAKKWKLVVGEGWAGAEDC